MSERGVFAVDRGIWDDPDFAGEPFSEREAFLWLVSEAAWRPTKVRVGKAVIDLARGQCSFSTRFMAGKWQWSEARVRRFLERRVNGRSIDADTDAGVTRVTICNYDKFQRVGIPSDAPSDAAATQQRRSSDAKKKQGNIETEDTSSLRSEDAVGVASIAAADVLDGEILTPEPEDPEKRLFDTGKAVLGPTAGGQIAKLLKAHKGDVGAAQARIDRAAKAQKPSEFIAGCIKAATTGPPFREQPMTRTQAHRSEARAALRELKERAQQVEGNQHH